MFSGKQRILLSYLLFDPYVQSWRSPLRALLDMLDFIIFLVLQNDRKLMWQKQQQVGSYMACAPFVNLVQ